MDLASDLSPQVSRGFFRARDFVAFFCLLHVLLGQFFGVLNPGWKPFKSSSWKTFLGRIKGRIRGVSEPYQGRIRAIKAVSGPYQPTLVLQLGQSSCDNVAPNGSRG